MSRLVLFFVLVTSAALGRDDGRYAQAPADMREWFKSILVPGSRVACCDISDGEVTTQGIRRGADGNDHWFVFADDQWIEVPDGRVVNEPNLLGRPLVWLERFPGISGSMIVRVRCFMPGALG